MIAGDAKEGQQFTISCCPCRFVCLGRDYLEKGFVVFKQIQACKTFCDFAKGQLLSTPADRAMDCPGYHVLTPVEATEP